MTVFHAHVQLKICEPKYIDPVDLVWVSGIVFKHVTDCLVLDRLGLFCT